MGGMAREIKDGLSKGNVGDAATEVLFHSLAKQLRHRPVER